MVGRERLCMEDSRQRSNMTRMSVEPGLTCGMPTPTRDTRGWTLQFALLQRMMVSQFNSGPPGGRKANKQNIIYHGNA